MSRSNPKPYDKEDFAKQVIWLFDELIGRPHEGEKPYANKPPKPVETCAKGLVFIRNLLNDHRKQGHGSEGFEKSGYLEAIGILEYLTSGRDHPISNHVAGISLGSFCKIKQQPVGIIDHQRRLVVGAIAAIHEYDGLSQKDALLSIERKFKNKKLGLTAGVMKGWIYKFRKFEDSRIQNFKNEIVRRAKKNKIKAIDIAATMISQNWTTNY